jgi:hypothetical protein
MSDIPTVDISEMKVKGRRGNYTALDKIAEEKLDSNKGIFLTLIKDNFGISEQSLRNHVAKKDILYKVQILTHKETNKKAAFFISK